MNLWYVGQYKSGGNSNAVWDFQGVFDNRDKAVAACRNHRYFIAPIVLNEELPDETITANDFEWAGYDKLPEEEKYAAWQDLFASEVIDADQ